MSYFVTGGTMQNDAESYVERPADSALLSGLLAGEFCYILTSRQMGKSSLMVRAADRLMQIGVSTVLIDLTEIGGENVTPEQWYFGLLEGLSQALDLEDTLESFWLKHSQLSPVQRLFSSIESVVLPHLEERAPTSNTPVRLAIFIDEIDVVRSTPFATDEFFASVRSCYNRRSQDARLNALTFCLIGVASPSDLIQDPQTTPFNIGTRIVIEDFAEQEVFPLREGFKRIGIPRSETEMILDRVLYWTHGHPYLTQRLCRAVTENYLESLEAPGPRRHQTAEQWVDQSCDQILIGDRSRETDDNLIFVREQILRYEGDTADLLRLYERIRNRFRIAHDQLDPAIERLLLAGVIRRENKHLAVRNRVYEQVFDRSWIEANMPKAELLRERDQRRALFRLRLILASASAVVIFVISTFVFLRLTDGLHAEIQRKNASIQLGASHEALAQIKDTAWTSILPSYRAAGIDLALTSLTTPDLRPSERKDLKLSPAPFALSNQGEHYAVAETEGVLRIHSFGNRAPGSSSENTFPLTITHLRWSPNDRFIAVRCQSGGIPRHIILNVGNHKQFTIPPRDSLHCRLEFDPSRDRITAGWDDGAIQIFDINRKSLLHHWPPDLSSTGYSCLRYSPDGSKLLAAQNGSLDITCFSLVESEQQLVRIRQTSTQTFPVDLEWHPTGQHIVIAESDGTLRWWDFEDAPPRYYKKLQGTRALTDLCFSRDGVVLAAICSDSTLRLWRPHSGQELLRHTIGPASNLQICNQNRYLTFISESPRRLRSFELFGTEGLSTLFMPNPNPRKLPSISFSSQDMLVAANGGNVSGWHLQSPSKTFSLPIKPTSTVKFEENQTSLMTAGGRGLLKVPIKRFTTTNHTTVQFENPIAYHLPTGLESLTTSTNGLGAALRRDRERDRILFFRFDNSQEHQVFTMDRSYYQLRLSPSGQWLAATSNPPNSQLQIWEVSQENGPHTLELIPLGQMTAARHFAFSADETWIATATEHSIILTELDQWPAPPSVTYPHRLKSSDYIPLAFGTLYTDDKQILAAAIDLDTIKVFEVPRDPTEELKPLFTTRTPSSDPLVNLSFSPFSCHLAAQTMGSSLFVWHLEKLVTSLAQLGIGKTLPRFSSNTRTPPILHVQSEIERTRLRPPHLFLPFRWTKIYDLDMEIAQETDRDKQATLRKEQADTIQRLGLLTPPKNRPQNALQLQTLTSPPNASHSIPTQK